ncbi:MAG: enoyl-CoA hydratase/isomerase family protein [Rhizobiales bacterium]|nr:enoyl-CoA hydratase/isomerase family protein [Hyphomicrobiales bacterium]
MAEQPSNDANVVTLRNESDVAVVTIDNPPVNALRHAVRAGLAACFDKAEADAAIKAVVVACAGRTFVAGADITEFGKPPVSPILAEVCKIVEGMSKPVVAAIHGTALGGGLELALACHYRVSDAGARMGLPEVKLGILPGAGGTQLLPRAIGPEEAVRMIVTGEMIGAKKALALGLIDAIVDGDLTQGAVAFARKLVTEKKPLRRLRDQEDKLAATRKDPKKFDEIAASLTARLRGLRAPVACVESVRNSFTLPVDEGMEREREIFRELVTGDQSKAQRYIFFAEREASKVADMPAGVKPRDVKRAAVIGAGTMGGGIAMCFASAGIPVTVIETSDEALQRGLGIIRKNYEASAKRGAFSMEDAEKRIGLMTGTIDFNAVKDADFVIEAVFEEMDIKKDVFGRLDKIAKPDAILATNTSYLDVNVIAQSTMRQGSVLGTHFFSPANVMRLLEIVRGKATAPDVLATAVAVGRKIGKVPAIVGVCHGFVGNRMLRARSIEAERMLIEGALPQDVDGAIVEFGFPMGPFAMSDLAGIDVGARARKALGVRAEIADAIADLGRYGQKTGRGFYIYNPGSRTPQPDPEVEAIIVAASKKNGITRRTIDKKEIVERLIFPMINEGAQILEEGIAQRPSDIDVIWVYGYGWPIWRGGPMFYADQIGLPYIRDRLAEYAKRANDPRLEPGTMLNRLADQKATFASLTDSKKTVA